MHLHFLDGRIQIINLPWPFPVFTEHAPVSGLQVVHVQYWRHPTPNFPGRHAAKWNKYCTWTSEIISGAIAFSY